MSGYSLYHINEPTGNFIEAAYLGFNLLLLFYGLRCSYSSYDLSRFISNRDGDSANR
ncbi:hypothetical protein D3C77_642540 [compost metagenome]